jgi:hypothetical protein
MYLIIIIQNTSSFINKCLQILEQKSISIFDVIKNKQMILSGVKDVLGFLEFYIIVFFIILSIMSFCLLKKMLNGLKDYKDEAFQLKVTSIKNVNYQYVITYFSAYIFPFITINLSTLAGILQFAVLWGLIGYIYVKNNLIFINPTLNIFFKYNIYETDMEYKDEGETISFSAVLLSKKEGNSIKKVQVIKESEGLYIES